MNYTNKMLIIFVMGVFTAPLYPVSLDDLTGPGQAAILRSSTSPVTEVQLKNPKPKLLPEHNEIKQLVNNARLQLQPSILIEALFLYRKPQGTAQTGKWTEVQKLNLFNQTLSLSTLAGIQYFSESRGAMRTFYETSLIIDGPDTKKPLPDPVFTVTPRSHTIYARQKDLTFGDNIYRYNYYTYSDAMVFIQENLTAMNAGLIPALGKNKLLSFLVIFDAGDYLLIYAASMAKAVSLPGLDERISNSFINRAEAILKWFTNRAEKALI
jgi:hypothetical protein